MPPPQTQTQTSSPQSSSSLLLAYSILATITSISTLSLLYLRKPSIYEKHGVTKFERTNLEHLLIKSRELEETKMELDAIKSKNSTSNVNQIAPAAPLLTLPESKVYPHPLQTLNTKSVAEWMREGAKNSNYTTSSPPPPSPIPSSISTPACTSCAKITRDKESERKGRISSEIKLRKYVKYTEQLVTVMNGSGVAIPSFNDGSEGVDGESPLTSSPSPSSSLLPLIPIGYIQSPYLKRTGTPRQGSLVKSGIGFLQMDKSINMECFDGIEAFSHLWIIFNFHANTDIRESSSNVLKDGKINPGKSGVFADVKSKVLPPRSSTKVGCLATRTPHRLNNVGLSLVSLRGIDTKKRRLWIAGLDLCEGTPVFDVKPVVPWDIPTYFSNARDDLRVIGRASPLDGGFGVPEWVWEDKFDALKKSKKTKSVVFKKDAEDELEEMFKRKAFAPLYEPAVSKKGKKNLTSLFGTFEDVKLAISEILIQDPRQSRLRGTETLSSSSAAPKKENVSEDEGLYKIIFCKAYISFVVDEEGEVEVRKVGEVEWDEDVVGDGVRILKV